LTLFCRIMALRVFKSKRHFRMAFLSIVPFFINITGSPVISFRKFMDFMSIISNSMVSSAQNTMARIPWCIFNWLSVTKLAAMEPMVMAVAKLKKVSCPISFLPISLIIMNNTKKLMAVRANNSSIHIFLSSFN